MQRFAGSALLMLMMASPVFAQEKPVEINFGGGLTLPLGGVSDSFDVGWNGAVGATFNISPMLGVSAEYEYSRLGGPDRTIPISNLPSGIPTSSGVIESNHQMHAGVFDLVVRPPSSDPAVNGYFLGGFGIYHRVIQLTTPSVGYTTICDPYWLVCYPTLVSVDRIIGDRSSNDFGINFGGGVTIGREAKFYIEARYHYVWGPEVKPDPPLASGTCSNGCSTNAQYFPLTFGFRF
jgi:Outer membrane protein beta-barrel domain